MKPNIILIGDFAKDLDDEHALLLLANLHKRNLCSIKGVIGNLKPAILRAQVAKGTLNQIGLGDIPVGVGSDVFEDSKEYPYEKEVSYKSKENELTYGELLLKDIFMSANDNSLTLVLNSGLTDAATFVRENTKLFQDKIFEVIIMGGAQKTDNHPQLTGHHIQPDDANNLTYNWAEGVWLYARLQELNIRTVITTRNTAYGCKIPFSMYNELEETGNVIGKTLKDRQRPSLEHLWKESNASEGSSIRGRLPPRCNREWFIETFCNNIDPGNVDSIWEYTGSFNLYDSMNVIASIPELRKQFFNESFINGKNKFSIVGVSEDNNGIKNENTLRRFIIDNEVEALGIRD